MQGPESLPFSARQVATIPIKFYCVWYWKATPCFLLSWRLTRVDFDTRRLVKLRQVHSRACQCSTEILSIGILLHILHTYSTLCCLWVPKIGIPQSLWTRLSVFKSYVLLLLMPYMQAPFALQYWSWFACTVMHWFVWIVFGIAHTLYHMRIIVVVLPFYIRPSGFKTLLGIVLKLLKPVILLCCNWYLLASAKVEGVSQELFAPQVRVFKCAEFIDV